jgi:hypothetical protein
MLQKKAPNILKSLDADMEWPRLEGLPGLERRFGPFTLLLRPEAGFASFSEERNRCSLIPMSLQRSRPTSPAYCGLLNNEGAKIFLPVSH